MKTCIGYCIGYGLFLLVMALALYIVYVASRHPTF